MEEASVVDVGTTEKAVIVAGKKRLVVVRGAATNDVTASGPIFTVEVKTTILVGFALLVLFVVVVLVATVVVCLVEVGLRLVVDIILEVVLEGAASSKALSEASSSRSIVLDIGKWQHSKYFTLRQHSRSTNKI